MKHLTTHPQTVPYPNRLGYCIKKYGYTFAEVADEIGVARRTLTYYIAGERAAPRYCLEKVARLLGCELEELTAVQSPLTTNEEQGPQETLALLSTSDHHVLNEALLTALETDLVARWNLFYSAGAIHASFGLEMWVKEIAALAHLAQHGQLSGRLQGLLALGYQLQSCVARDVMDYRQAHITYQRAFEVAQELEDTELIGAALAREGITLTQQGKPQEALLYLTGALNILENAPFPVLQGHLFQALSEAYAKIGQAHESSTSLGHAEQFLTPQEQMLEHSLIRGVTPASLAAQKGVNAALLGDARYAVSLLDQGLHIYNPALPRARARLFAQKAEALLHLHQLEEGITNVQEAFRLAKAAGAARTIEQVKQVYTTLTRSPWRQEPYVIHLGRMITEEG